VLVVPLNVTDAEVMNVATNVYTELQNAGVDVLMDDRDDRPGSKFKDADLIGFPLRVVIGGKGLKEGLIEVKWRTAKDPEKIPVADAIQFVLKSLAARREEESKKVPT